MWKQRYGEMEGVGNVFLCEVYFCLETSWCWELCLHSQGGIIFPCKREGLIPWEPGDTPTSSLPALQAGSEFPLEMGINVTHWAYLSRLGSEYLDLEGCLSFSSVRQMTHSRCQNVCLWYEKQNALLETGSNERRAEKEMWNGGYRGGPNIILLLNRNHCSVPACSSKPRK